MKKIALITGATSGIGKATAALFAKHGIALVLCGRRKERLEQIEKSLSKLTAVHTLNFDVRNREKTLNAIAALPEAFKNIDILINNAGILSNQRLSDLDYEQMLEQFKVNTLGPIRVTEAVLPHMVTGSKVAFITSRMGSIEDNTSGGTYGYRMSKCALNAAGKSFSLDLKSRGISVALLHPGYVQTEMVNFGGEISAELSASRLLDRIEELDISNSGAFWHSNGDSLPW